MTLKNEKYLTAKEKDDFLQRIKRFPNLNRLVTRNKMKGKLKRYYRGDEFNIFGMVLSEQNYWHLFLTNLNELVKDVNVHTDKRKRDRLFDNVFNYVTELEFVKKVIESGLTPETDVVYYKGKDIDCKLPSGVFIEITTPKLNQRDDNTWKQGACAVPLSFWVKETILRKIETQEINYAVKEGFAYPILILINGIYRGIEGLHVYCSIKELQSECPSVVSSVTGIILMRNENLQFIPNSMSSNKLTKENGNELVRMGVQFYECKE